MKYQRSMDALIRLDVIAILLGAVVTSTIYAAFLNRIQERYTPNWTWLTVVGGTVLTWGWYAALCWRGVLPWSAAQWFVYLYLATGAPIIAWQLGQWEDRRRKKIQRNGHGPIDARRPGAHHQDR